MQPAALLYEPMNPIIEFPYVCIYSQDHAVFSYDELFFRYPVRVCVYVKNKQPYLSIWQTLTSKKFFHRTESWKRLQQRNKGINSFIYLINDCVKIKKRMKIKSIKYHVAKDSCFTAIQCRFAEISNLNYIFISCDSTFKILNIISLFNIILGLCSRYYFYSISSCKCMITSYLYIVYNNFTRNQIMQSWN